jgi:hypothetical protein
MGDPTEWWNDVALFKQLQIRVSKAIEWLDSPNSFSRINDDARSSSIDGGVLDLSLRNTLINHTTKKSMNSRTVRRLIPRNRPRVPPTEPKKKKKRKKYQSATSFVSITFSSLIVMVMIMVIISTYISALYKFNIIMMMTMISTQD